MYAEDLSFLSGREAVRLYIPGRYEGARAVSMPYSAVVALAVVAVVAVIPFGDSLDVQYGK